MPHLRRAVIASMVALAAAGAACGDGGGGSDDLADPGGGGVDGPVMYGPPPRSAGADGALIEGTLDRDRDCLYVVSDDPALPRYPVLWPYDTAWQAEPEGVVLPDDTFVAVGASFSLCGGHPSAGRLAVGDLAEAAVERAADCAEGKYREVAVVRSDVDVD